MEALNVVAILVLVVFISCLAVVSLVTIIAGPLAALLRFIGMERVPATLDNFRARAALGFLGDGTKKDQFEYRDPNLGGPSAP